jgi:hypothetical protein
VFADDTGADQDVAVILDRDVMPTFSRPQPCVPKFNCCVVKTELVQALIAVLSYLKSCDLKSFFFPVGQVRSSG